MTEWATVAGIYPEIDMWWIKKMRLKRFMQNHEADLRTIQQWSYVFSWSYTAQEMLDVFLAWPWQVYEHITLLEWRSMYDIDAYLAKKWLIEAWEYIAFVTDLEIIDAYIKRYDFLAQAKIERSDLSSLEWYIYPDTYYVDPDKNVVDQLLYLQLEWFQKNIWSVYGDELKQLPNSLKNKGYDFSLSTYGALILWSIIEKEERYGPNRVDIASVFYNRLDTWMRIDADISLCYGLQTWYESCTPQVIWASVADASNPYNTRVVAWLPPTPITSPTVSSIQALINTRKTTNFFYLHDPEGNLHMAETLNEHVINKNKYL